MAISPKEKAVYVVLIETDDEGTYAYSAHFNKDDADQIALDKNARVLTTGLRINYVKR